MIQCFQGFTYKKSTEHHLYDMAWVQDVLLDSKTSQIFLMTVHWVVNMLWLNSVMRHILQKSTWGEFFSCCSSNNKQPFYTSKLLMLPKDTILELLQVRPYFHLFNGQSKCSNQGPVPISLVQPFGQQGLQWPCLVSTSPSKIFLIKN